MLNKIIELGISKREAEELIKVSKNIKQDYIKLKNNYPIQYLIGYVNFYGNKIYVNDSVLIPRYETEYLVEKTIKLCKNKFDYKINVLDLCTGSGAIGISLKKEINCNVTMSDISKSALNVSKKNIIENNVDVNIVESDLFKNIKGKFDVIISNPPYINKKMKLMPTVFDYEPHLALFAEDEGLYYYKKIFEQIISYLNDKFILAFEIGYEQKDKLNKLAVKHFKNCLIRFEKDLNGKYRYLFIISE